MGVAFETCRRIYFPITLINTRFLQITVKLAVKNLFL